MYIHCVEVNRSGKARNAALEIQWYRLIVIYGIIYMQSDHASEKWIDTLNYFFLPLSSRYINTK